jgi:hypothetical protein
MRATFFLLICFITMGLFIWVTMEGALFFLCLLLCLGLLVMTVGYPDTMTLFLLGARELRSGDEQSFFEAASQEAYKLSVPMPKLYFYNGTLERAFVLQVRNSISIILNKSLLEKASTEELKGICFELLLQVKKGMAPKRTKAMFAMGVLAWLLHATSAVLMYIIPQKNIQKATNWFLSFLFFPVIDVMFKVILGGGYFKKLEQYLKDYPAEKELLSKVGLKLRKPYTYYSLPSRKIHELHAVSKSRNFQNIMTLEFLPHEWDYLFKNVEIRSAE